MEKIINNFLLNSFFNILRMELLTIDIELDGEIESRLRVKIYDELYLDLTLALNNWKNKYGRN